MASSINGLGDYFSQYNEVSTSKTSADSLETSINSTDYSTASQDELMKVCKDFESYFLEQVFKSMKKMVPESKDKSSTGSSYLDYFGDSLVQEMAASATETNDFGIAKMLYEQMKRNYNVSEE